MTNKDKNPEEEQNEVSVLKTSLNKSSFSEYGKEILEVVIDSTLTSELLKSFPIVSTLTNGINFYSSFRDNLLQKKIIKFLNNLESLSKDEIQKMVYLLSDESAYSYKVGASILEILDRLEASKKPEFAGRCFAGFAKQEITFKELRRVLFALERIPAFDIEEVKKFNEANHQTLILMDEAFLLNLVNAGLGVNNGGLDGGLIRPTKLCKKFAEFIIEE